MSTGDALGPLASARPQRHHPGDVSAQDVRIVVNGAPRTLRVEPVRLLIDVLRDELGLTGTKLGCGIGVCGACTVLVDGSSMSACLLLVGACAGRDVVTIEGIASSSDLHPVQRSFLECDALQCGYCTPGQIMAACALLADDPAPTDEAIVEGMLGNLCRCTGYHTIREAVHAAAERMRQPE